MNQIQPEKRKFRRLPFRAHITLTGQVSNQVWRTDLSDISLHGLLIDTPEGFSTDGEETYRVEITFGDNDFTIQMSDAVIAHLTEGHIGLRSRLIDLDGITHLRRLIEFNLGDPELLHRELESLGR